MPEEKNPMPGKKKDLSAPLTDEQKAALKKWYLESGNLEKIDKFIKCAGWVELEEYVHMVALFPLSRHELLPEYMKNQEGKTLFPCNLNPRNNVEGWQDATEVGWQVVQETHGLSRDELHLKIKNIQDDDWEVFLKRAEKRKKEKESN